MAQDLVDLGKKYGTPLYVYDGDKIKEKYSSFKSAFNVNSLKIHYAAKALTNLSILRLFKELGSGLDCVSPQEISLGLKAGFSPEDIIFTPNGVSLDEYREAIALGVKITIDNISTLEKIGQEYPGLPIFIRLNPHLMAGGNHKISVGHIGSKFGISIHQMPNVHRLIKNYDIEVEGIHIHTGSDIVDPDIFGRVADLIFSIADEFESIRSIDFGSGFKVKYKADDLFTDMITLGKQFSDAFNSYCNKRDRDLTLRFEPGKFMVSEAGSFLVNVNVIKQTTACSFAAVDSGFNHLIRPMFYEAHHEIENISNPNGDKKMYSIVGNICETDTFAEDRVISEIREGDTLCFNNAGAYCFSMASQYNSRFRPPEVLLFNGKDYLIRERETLDSLTRNQVAPEIPEWQLEIVK